MAIVRAYKQISKEFLTRKLVNIIRKNFKRFNTPLEQVFLDLKSELLLPQKIIALELFGRCGLSTTKDYYHLTDYLELYEIDPIYAKFAGIFFKKAKVITADSIEIVKKGRLLRNDYNLVVIDNPDIPLYNENKYCEHFDLFPYLLDKVANDVIFGNERSSKYKGGVRTIS